MNEPRKSSTGESRLETRILPAPSAVAGSSVDPGGEGPVTGEDTPEGEVRDRQASRLSVLVVDDEESIREFFAVFLAQEGHRVKTLDDPRHALEVLRSDTYHVVILDLMMPELSGMDLLEQIRRTDDDIAIVICTGYPTVETATVSISHEVSAYIRKPFEPAELRSVLERIAKKKGLVLRREDQLHQTIGRNIREQRKSRGLTLKQMARRTNLSVSLLSQIERAESSASVSSLFKVATALDVPITELFGDF